MSTLEVACARCDKQFRVRAEFAGKSTRCPGCSAPITIGGSKPAPPPDDRVEKPRSRPRPRDDEDRPSLPAGDWRPVDTALGREQLAVLFGLLTIVCSFLSYCLLRLGEGPAGGGSVFLVFGLLLLAGPSLLSGIFGVVARVSALGAPAESIPKGAAVASLLCAIAGIFSLVVFGISVLLSFERQGREPFATVVAAFGMLFSTLTAVSTFTVFVAQVGIARRTPEVGLAFGRASVGVAVCVLALLGISFLFALASEMSEPAYSPNGSYRSHHEEEMMMVVLGLLVPIALAVIFILYHRVLAAARLAVRGESRGMD
jgi:hypothetical protein